MISLKVKEMSCSHCVERISNLLKGMDLSFEIHLDEKRVCLNATEDQIKKVIMELDDIGFTANIE